MEYGKYLVNKYQFQKFPCWSKHRRYRFCFFSTPLEFPGNESISQWDTALANITQFLLEKWITLSILSVCICMCVYGGHVCWWEERGLVQDDIDNTARYALMGGA